MKKILATLMMVGAMGLWSTATWADEGPDCCGDSESCCKEVEKESTGCCDDGETSGEGECCKSSSGHDHSHEGNH